MILVNFANPINAMQKIQLEELAGESLAQTFLFKIVPESDVPVSRQLANLMKKLTVSEEDLRGQRIVWNPPGQAVHNTMIVAALYGRLGVFPLIMRTRPLMYSLPPRTEVTELVDLQQLYLDSQPV